MARGFRECWGMSLKQLEDVYQDTVLALLGRRYVNEEHLRNALRAGIKHRALNLHRNERRHWEILNEHASQIRAFAQADDAQREPERTALIHQDRLIVIEFLAELTELERRVFALFADGMRYAAIAAALSIDPNRARKAARAFERKRARFQLLYEAGRLCGFRAGTIAAMQLGQAMGSELAQRALAHLEHCAQCRDDHATNVKRLRLPALTAPRKRSRCQALAPGATPLRESERGPCSADIRDGLGR